VGVYAANCKEERNWGEWRDKVEIKCVVYEACSKAEAEGLLLAEAKELFRPANGWTLHSVFAMEVPQELIDKYATPK
jgi:hypothetical protein